MNKKLLANIAVKQEHKIRRLQAICYLSLFVIIEAMICLLLIILRG